MNRVKISKINVFEHKIIQTSAAGVVVSCKIPILATRVRFPGGADIYY